MTSKREPLLDMVTLISRAGAYLELNLGFRNVLLASAAVGNLLGLGDLGLDSLGAEALQRVTLSGVDAHDRVGLNNGKTARH